MLDLLIRGGTLIDGTGAPPRRADVGVRGGRVEATGDLSGAEAREVVAAEGAWVAPGFVDIHTHYDLCLDWEGLSPHCLRQGITTVVGGNCGLGDPDVAAVLGRAARAGLGLHFGVLAPLGPLRSRVVPRSAARPARPDELPLLEAEVGAALDAGALGLSWGPYHANLLAPAAELEVCLRPAAARGKPFVVHRRSEGAGGLEATREALALARATGVRLQVSHLKVAGRANWDHLEPVLSDLEAARRDLDVAVDVYPYDASLTYLSAVVPDALKAAGRLGEHLATRGGRAEARRGVEGWFVERQGADRIVVHEPALPGLGPGGTLADAARALGVDPAEAALRLIEADPAGTGGWATYLEMMAPRHVAAILDLPWAAVASDAVPDEQGGGLGASTHPRAFATFARAVERASERGEAALADAVRRATAFPAERLGLDRGVLAPGRPADVVVLREPRDRATHARPDRYPEGVEAVVVAGRVAFAGGEPTGERAGEVLAR